MKFEIVTSQSDRWGLRAVAADYDGIPLIDTLWMDAAPKVLQRDRLAVAAVLAFGSYCAGRLEFPQAVAPATAGAIRRYLEPLDCEPGPIEYYPKALSEGSSVLELIDEPFEEVGEKAAETLAVLPAHRYAHSLAVRHGTLIASNAETIDVTSPGPSFARLAVAVLFAEEMAAGYVHADARLVGGRRERDLCLAARLGVRPSVTAVHVDSEA